MTLSSKALKRWIYVRKFFPRIQSTLVFFNTYNIKFFEFSVSFQNYNDREEVLRRSKLIRGLSTPGASGRGVKPMGCHSEPHLYITEDTSRRVREHRSELIKFSREVHRRFPRWLNLRKFFTSILGSSYFDFLMCQSWKFEYYVLCTYFCYGFFNSPKPV